MVLSLVFLVWFFAGFYFIKGVATLFSKFMIGFLMVFCLLLSMYLFTCNL